MGRLEGVDGVGVSGWVGWQGCPPGEGGGVGIQPYG